MQKIHIATAIITGLACLFLVYVIIKVSKLLKIKAFHDKYLRRHAVHYDIDIFKHNLARFLKEAVLYNHIASFQLLLYGYIDRAIEMVETGIFLKKGLFAKAEMLEQVLDTKNFIALQINVNDSNTEEKRLIEHQWTDGFFRKFEIEVVPLIESSFKEIKNKINKEYFCIDSYLEELAAMKKIVTLSKSPILKRSFFDLKNTILMYLKTHPNEIKIFKEVFEGYYEDRELMEPDPIS